ncbi:MAG: ABC transporter ATP-binding protein [Christensenellaceae bacterium]|jgi:putative ABC transport system ATP-binding protein
MQKLLECKDLTKVFGEGEAAVTAVKDATLSFAEGIHIIMGKSGSGKSTLLHMLGGLEEPTKGEVIFETQNIYKVKHSEDIRLNHFGFVFQAYNLIPELSVQDNILMPLYLSKKKDTAFFEEVIEMLDIKNRIKSMPTTLSGGEQQRVAIARALMNHPQIIFADEPTGNLDQENGKAVIDLLIDVCKRFKATLIMVTHDSDLLQYADYSYYMQDGEIAQQ